MKYTYTEIIHNEEVVGILRNEDKAAIPLDPANSDYQRYLNPEAEHFTPSLQPKLDKWNYPVILSGHGTYTLRTDSRAVTQSL